MNAIHFSFSGWMVRASWQAAVLTVIVLAAQWIFQKQLSARWRHALWFLVVARLMMPVLPSSPVSVFNLARRDKVVDKMASAAVATQSVPETVSRSYPSVTYKTEETPPVAEVSSTSSAVSIPVAAVAPAAKAPIAKAPVVRASWFRWENAPTVGAVIWLAGVSFFTARFLGQNWLFLRRLGAPCLVTDAGALGVLESCKAQMGLSATIRLAETDMVKSPALYGFWRKTLLLPSGMTSEFGAGELRHIFLHELAHIKRRDMEVLWLVAVGKIAHWFNPVLWYGFCRMAADRELACDELALSSAGIQERRAYGETILKLLELSVGPAAVPGVMGIMEGKAQMRRRISMIAKFKQRSRWSALAGVLLLAVGLVTLTDAETENAGVALETSSQTNPRFLAGTNLIRPVYVAVWTNHQPPAPDIIFARAVNNGTIHFTKVAQSPPQTNGEVPKAASNTGGDLEKQAADLAGKVKAMVDQLTDEKIARDIGDNFDGSRAQLLKSLQARGLTFEDYRTQLEDQILTNYGIRTVPSGSNSVGVVAIHAAGFSSKDQAALDKEADEMIQREITNDYNGDRTQFNKYLQFRGLTYEEYRKEKENLLLHGYEGMQAAQKTHINLGQLPKAIAESEAAIAVYEKERKSGLLYDKDRTDAAAAVFRLGLLYMQFGGHGDPQQQFHRILTEFPDQTNLVPLSQQYELELPKTPPSYVLSINDVSHPGGVAVDSAGNVYVSDMHDNCIRKFNGQGELLKKWGEPGADAGNFLDAQGLAIDESNNLYVAEMDTRRVQKFSVNGIFKVQWGDRGSQPGQFNSPCSVAVDRAGNLYVLDKDNFRVEKFNGEGEFLQQFDLVRRVSDRVQAPQGVAVDAAGNVYAGDGSGRIEKFSALGEYLGEWTVPDAHDVAADAQGNVYVVDAGEDCVKMYSSAGELLTQWGSKGSGPGQFDFPTRVAVDAAGMHVYVTDANNNRVQVFAFPTAAGP